VIPELVESIPSSASIF